MKETHGWRGSLGERCVFALPQEGEAAWRGGVSRV